MDKVYYNPWQFSGDLDQLVLLVQQREGQRGQKFKYIWTPFNGGAILAACLAYRLSDEANGHVVKIIRRTPKKYDPEILIVDEIIDSGKTLEKFHKMGFVIVSIYKHTNSSFEPTFFIRVKHEAWVIFFWTEKGLLLDVHRI